jgi:hypothetical protein
LGISSTRPTCSQACLKICSRSRSKYAAEVTDSAGIGPLPMSGTGVPNFIA